MRCYGMPEKDAWLYSTKEPDAIRHKATRKWYKRYVHKAARSKAKGDLRYAQETQEQEAFLQNVQATQNGQGYPMEGKGA